uniref:Aquaporin PIP1-2 n=1 Tax=Ananas comosus var. bracteatus TaxID=296719 RepID=A0A6V7NR78_ANACO|nr:unnamed protein product [Ananas comosus var. bracteatus]
MEGKEEDVRVGANKFPERQPIGTAAQSQEEGRTTRSRRRLRCSSPGAGVLVLLRAGIAEFMATFLFLYITVLTVMGVNNSPSKCSTVGIQGIAWAFGGMIFALVYCTAGISGGHINPAVTFGLLLARKLSGSRRGSTRAVGRGQCCRPWIHQRRRPGAEIVGTFILVYTVFSATDAKRSARDSHVPILAPLPIGFAVFLVHLATIPITAQASTLLEA